MEGSVAERVDGVTNDVSAHRQPSNLDGPPRYHTRSRDASNATRPDPRTSSLQPGAQLPLACAGSWPGGRLVLCGGSASAGRGDNGDISANTAFATLEDAEALYRTALPYLSVTLERDGKRDAVDYVRDCIMDGPSCLTAGLLLGSGGSYDDYGEQQLLGALTLQVHAAQPGAREPLLQMQCVGAHSGEESALPAPARRSGTGAVGDADASDCGSLSVADAHVCILTTAVQKGWLRRGIGSLLVRWAQHLAAATGVRCMLVAASKDVLDYWRRLGFLHPTRAVPTEWIDSLERRFDDSTVLFCDPCEVHADMALTAAVERLASNRAAVVGTAKRQKVQ